MNFAFGLLLLTFRTFWSGEGRGIDWPLEDGVIPVLLNIYIATSLAAVWLLHARLDRRLAALLGAGVSSRLVGLVLVAAIIAVESFTLWRR